MEAQVVHQIMELAIQGSAGMFACKWVNARESSPDKGRLSWLFHRWTTVETNLWVFQ